MVLGSYLVWTVEHWMVMACHRPLLLPIDSASISGVSSAVCVFVCVLLLSVLV